MSTSYKRKSIRNLDQLNEEQEKVARKLQEMESNFLGFLSPQSLLMATVSGLLSKGNKGQKKSTVTAKSAPLFSTSQANKAKSKLATIGKKIGISFLKWQAFNLALYLGGKLIDQFKEKRQLKKLEKQIKKYST